MAGQQEEAVIVRAALPSGDDDDVIDALNNLEDLLIEAIASARAGELDGNEVGQGEVKLYMYGPDAERLFAAIEPVLRTASLTQMAAVTVRRGPPGSPSREVILGQ
jgi:hypothetical protein